MGKDDLLAANWEGVGEHEQEITARREPTRPFASRGVQVEDLLQELRVHIEVGHSVGNILEQSYAWLFVAVGTTDGIHDDIGIKKLQAV